MVLKVLFLYIPLPMFWALFDQQVTSTTTRHLLFVVVINSKFSIEKEMDNANPEVHWQNPELCLLHRAQDGLSRRPP